jgi:RimJ/RimL family protein N-acetyltransferase
MLIRAIRLDDAEAFFHLRQHLDEETQSMLLEPGERVFSVEEQHAQIGLTLTQENHTILVAEEGGQLVGYLEAAGGEFNRNRPCVSIVVGVLLAFSGQGIGTQLFIELETWAHEHHVHRLELTVMTHNQAGLRLYKKQGCEIEGTRNHALWVDGHYVDEYFMTKLLRVV